MNYFKYPGMLVTITTAAIMIACSSTIGQDKFVWERLAGKWVIQEGAKTQIEMWEAAPSGMIGKGIVMNNLDTTFVEELAILEVNGHWAYQAKVSGQNDDKPIVFKLENQTNNLIAFANYTHDFPQRIVYEFLSEGSMQVYIEGPRDGEKIRVVMDFKKQD
jgi:hypothetical protein